MPIEDLSGGDAVRETSGAEIAVVGLAGRFPGARSVEEFWENLCRGVESIRHFTDEELKRAGVPAETLTAPNYVRAGAPLDEPEMFDAAFFGFHPREAEVMDPQQRVFLECAWEALEQAGYDPQKYAGRIGVYAGQSLSTYLYNIYSNPKFLEAVDEFQIRVGNDKDYLATRVSYKLNLRGPSLSVQTACSTSLVAVHMACESLLGGQCDMALAGGASIRFPQISGYLYGEGGISSPDGHCRAFDARAHGTVGGSGVGVVVLKRLEDALADRDHIHAVIKGTAVNNDGSLKVGYTAPSVEGQAAVITETLALAGVEPRTIGYVEAHGTGTQLGDPIEVAALTQAFGAQASGEKFCALGSVKTNIGHLDAAAGVTGLIKTVLCLEHGVLPASLHFVEPNPQANFEDSPFYVNAETSRWERGRGPRRAAVSSFGIGGTNAHAVLEEAPPAPPTDAACNWLVLPVSARTPAALDAAASRLAEHLSGRGAGLELTDVAHTLQVGRRHFPHRRAWVCSGEVTTASALDAGETWECQPLLPAGEPKRREVAFLFPGQGAQRVNMGRALYDHDPTFRECVADCCDILRPLLGRDLRELIYPAGDPTADAESRLTETAFAQPALFVVEYALARTLDAWGVRPQALLGHSIGEYVAACVAGVFSSEDGLKLVAARGRLMQQAEPGVMLAVRLEEGELCARLEGASLSLAAVNGPALCVIGGPAEEAAAFERELIAEGIWASRLHTSHAFHTASMQSAVEPFVAEVARVKLSAPQVPFLSNVTGDWIREEEATSPVYWGRHLRETVRFGEGVSKLLEGTERVLLEVGPGRALTALARRASEASGARVPALAALGGQEAGNSSEESLTRALGSMWVAGVDVDWQRQPAQRRAKRVPLPTYPFERQRYWVEPLAAPFTRPADERHGGERSELSEWFYFPVWEQTPRIAARGARPEAGSGWLVFADGGGLGQEVAALLREGGCRVSVVEAGDAYERHAVGRYSVRPGRTEDYERLLKDLGRTQGLPQRVLHLWGVTASEAPPPAASGQDELQSKGFESLLALAQAFGERFFATRAGDAVSGAEACDILVVSNQVEQVTGEESLCPTKALVLGGCRVIPQEYPHLSCRHLDVAPSNFTPGSLEPWAGLIVEEALRESEEARVALRGTSRWSLNFRRWPLAASDDESLPLRDGGVYLITGGLGAVGLELAGEIARRRAVKLALVGRRPPDTKNVGAARRLADLEGLGAEVLTLCADVSDRGQMARALAETRSRFGRIDGVVHAAGVAGGGVIQSRRTEEAAGLLAAKVRGTLVLDELLRGERLDFIALCSSLRSVQGGVGFVDYCAANAFLDAYAHYASASGGVRAVSINWDGWREGGMSVEAVERLHGRAGVEEQLGAGMLNAEAAEAFARALATGAPQVLVATRDLHTLLEEPQGVAGADLAAELSEARAPAASHGRPELHTPYVEPVNETQQRLARLWQEALGIDRVGINDNFFELGGDSIISIQIAARAKQVGIKLSPRQFYEHATVAELASAAGGEEVAAEQGAVTGPVPLTPIQRWFFELELSDPHHFNQAVMLELHDSPLPSVVEAALQELIGHHDALRLSFQSEGDEVRQVNEGARGELRLTRHDLSGLDEEGQREVLASAAREAQEGFDLASAPLVRAVHFHLGAGRPNLLLVVAHHLIIDAVSWRILLEDFAVVCKQLGRGESPELPPKTTSFKSWAEQLSRHANTEGVRRTLDSWLADGARPAAPLRRDFEGGVNTLASEQHVLIEFDAEETEQLLYAAPSAYQIQINDALLTALALAFAEWMGRPGIRLDLEGHGRDQQLEGVDISRTVGWFTSVTPVVFTLPRGADEGTALKAVKEQLRGYQKRGDSYGLLRYLCEDEGVRAGLRRLPRAEVSFLYLGQLDQLLPPTSRLSLSSLPVGETRGRRGEREYLLEVRGYVAAGRLRLGWFYSGEVFRPETIRALTDAYAWALRAIIEHCHTTETAFTPSDFPEAGLSQQDLDDLLTSFVEGQD